MPFSPLTILAITGAYFAVLALISWRVTRRAQADAFYLGTKKAPWYAIAFGMVGASISGVTFISVPGMVGAGQFAYLQMVLGFTLGYAVVAYALLPLYYKLGLTSIYTYLHRRFGARSYKTGAVVFLLSRLLVSAIRLLVVAVVLQSAVFDPLGVPFWANVALTLALIFLYTHRGGIGALIWTDALQTAAMLAALLLCLHALSQSLQLSLSEAVALVRHSPLSRIFFFDHPADTRYFWKQLLAGIFTTIAMTGLDQDLMQKNLSCKTLRDAQRSMCSYGAAFLPVNLLFLSLGVLLHAYVSRSGGALPAHPDALFPAVALTGSLSPALGVLFVLGIMAATYSSADSALTALTTSFTIDILGVKNSDPRLRQKRRNVHLALTLAFLLLILLLKSRYTQSLITTLYTVVSYAYGPLLGLFAFGMLTKAPVRDRYVPLVALLSPALSYALSRLSPLLLSGYHFGFELLIVNGAITFLGLLLLRKRP